MEHHLGNNHLGRHKYLRLIWPLVKNHPNKTSLSFFHGSVLVRNGKPIATGINSPARSFLSERYKSRKDGNTHSEVSAVANARSRLDLTGADIYNIRLGHDGKVRCSMPCLGCCRLMLDYGIRRCYYTTNEGHLAVFKVADVFNGFSLDSNSHSIRETNGNSRYPGFLANIAKAA